MEDYLKLYESSPKDRQNPYFALILKGRPFTYAGYLDPDGGFDPLYGMEGEDMGKRLKEANNYVEYIGFQKHLRLFCIKFRSCMYRKVLRS